MLAFTAAVVVLAQAGVTMSRAPGAAGECTKKTKRGDYGWLGLVQHGGTWELAPLRTRPSDGGRAYAGLCSLDTAWSEVALKGAALKQGTVEGVVVNGDDATCRLPGKTKLSLGGKAWAVSVKGERAEATSEGEVKVSYALGSDCWTIAWLGDLDGDAKPDLLLGRFGGGSVFALYLSSSARDGVVPRAASMNGPAD